MSAGLIAPRDLKKRLEKESNIASVNRQNVTTRVEDIAVTRIATPSARPSSRFLVPEYVPAVAASIFTILRLHPSRAGLRHQVVKRLKHGFDCH